MFVIIIPIRQNRCMTTYYEISGLTLILIIHYRMKKRAHSYHIMSLASTLQWRHDERDDVSNHRRLHCLLKCWFRLRSKETSNSASLAFVWGVHRWPANYKRSVTRKMFPFDDIIAKGGNNASPAHRKTITRYGNTAKKWDKIGHLTAVG